MFLPCFAACKFQKRRGAFLFFQMFWTTTFAKMESHSAPLIVSHDGATKAPPKKKSGKPAVPTKMEKEADLVMGVSYCD